MINKNFTLLWVGKLISQLGDKFYAIALAWWILQKTNSPAIMGFFLLVSVLPGILFGFFAGALTDRWKRKNILIVADIIRGCLVLAITIFSIYDMLEVWHVFLIGFLLSLATAFFDPAMQSIIPEIVEKEKLTKANGISQMVSGICTVAGPMLGAMAVSMLGLAWVFFANSISYYVSAFLTCFIEANECYENSDKETNIWEEIKEGIGFIKGHSQIVFLLIVIAIVHFFLGSLTVSLPFLANGLEGKGVNNLGYLEMMVGAGLFAGAMLISCKKKASIKERTLILFIFVMGLCFITVSIFQNIHLEIIYPYLPVMMIFGACIAFASVFWQSLLQNNTPAFMTGRVFSISTLIGNTSMPVAYGMFGVLLGVSSVSILSVICGGCLVLLCFSLYYLYFRNRIKEF